MANLLNINTWTVGSGSVTGFPMTGYTAESVRSISTDAWNKSAIIWQAQYDGVNSGYGDGGWWTSPLSMSIAFTYRFSVWVRKIALGSGGSIYFGTNGYNDVPALIGLTELGGANNTNSYFYTSASPPSNAIFPLNTWVLMIGHINYYGYVGGAQTTSGIWSLNGTKLSGMHYEYKWRSDNTKAEHRVYLVYSHPYTDTIVQFLYPRIDKCDGTEPSLRNLLVNQKYTFAFRTSRGTFNAQCKDVVSN